VSSAGRAAAATARQLSARATAVVAEVAHGLSLQSTIGRLRSLLRRVSGHYLRHQAVPPAETWRAAETLGETVRASAREGPVDNAEEVLLWFREVEAQVVALRNQHAQQHEQQHEQKHKHRQESRGGTAGTAGTGGNDSGARLLGSLKRLKASGSMASVLGSAADSSSAPMGTAAVGGTNPATTAFQATVRPAAVHHPLHRLRHAGGPGQVPRERLPEAVKVYLSYDPSDPLAVAAVPRLKRRLRTELAACIAIAAPGGSMGVEIVDPCESTVSPASLAGAGRLGRGLSRNMSSHTDTSPVRRRASSRGDAAGDTRSSSPLRGGGRRADEDDGNASDHYEPSVCSTDNLLTRLRMMDSCDYVVVITDGRHAADRPDPRGENGGDGADDTGGGDVYSNNNNTTTNNNNNNNNGIGDFGDSKGEPGAPSPLIQSETPPVTSAYDWMRRLPSGTRLCDVEALAASSAGGTVACTIGDPEDQDGSVTGDATAQQLRRSSGGRGSGSLLVGHAGAALNRIPSRAQRMASSMGSMGGTGTAYSATSSEPRVLVLLREPACPRAGSPISPQVAAVLQIQGALWDTATVWSLPGPEAASLGSFSDLGGLGGVGDGGSPAAASRRAAQSELLSDVVGDIAQRVAALFQADYFAPETMAPMAPMDADGRRDGEGTLPRSRRPLYTVPHVQAAYAALRHGLPTTNEERFAEIFEALHRFCSVEMPTGPMIVTGAPGSGKSHVLHRFLQQRPVSWPPTVTIYRALDTPGCAGGGLGTHVLIQGIILEIEDRCRLGGADGCGALFFGFLISDLNFCIVIDHCSPHPVTPFTSTPRSPSIGTLLPSLPMETDVLAAVARFALLLRLCSERQVRIALVLDNLEYMPSDALGVSLSWIPDPLPVGVQVIIGATVLDTASGGDAKGAGSAAGAQSAMPSRDADSMGHLEPDAGAWEDVDRNADPPRTQVLLIVLFCFFSVLFCLFVCFFRNLAGDFEHI
jgi:hypothetical protein